MDNTKKRAKRSCTGRLLPIIGVLTGLCLFVCSLSALSNRNLPEAGSEDHILELDKARLVETLQLKSALGDKVWQGWGTNETPIILWNKGYEFLVNYPGDPPTGWTIVPEDELQDKSYYRRPAHDPQNFAIPVGEVWTPSMATKSATDEFLIGVFKDFLPPPIEQVFPYRILIQPSETQIGGLLHETFHVYQIKRAPQRLDTSEAAHKLGDQYRSTAEKFQTEWKQESAILAKALEAKTNSEKAELVKQFLAAREARRKGYQLPQEFVDYERWLEWEEGVAKYVEVAILRAAYQSADYAPLEGMKTDPDFKKYQEFEQRWSREICEVRFQSTLGENWFYQSGMGQAFLLDDLMPDWKEKIFAANVFLEDLLAEAVAAD